MRDNRMEIKERKADLLSRGISFLFLAIASLLIACLPLISKIASKTPLPFYIIGGGLFLIFITLFITLIYHEFNPKTVLLLTSTGFVDKKNVGEGIEVQWTNVSSVKLLQRRNIPYLGVTIENSDIIIAQMKKGLADEMRENIEENLPSILISQEDVRISLNNLKDIFIKYIRESRVVENGTPQKPKSNPFSTEDVLRAFGKLPAEESIEESKSYETETEEVPTEEINEPVVSQPVIESKNENTEIASKEPEKDPIEASEEPDELSQTSFNSFDAFYELLQTKANEGSEPEVKNDDGTSHNTDADVHFEEEIVQTNSLDEFLSTGVSEKSIEPIDATEEDIPNEIIEILNRAKSSKISELGKILNEDTPFTYANPAKSYEEDCEETNELNCEPENTIEEIEQEPELKILPEINITDDETIIEEYKNDDFEIVIPQNLFEETKNEPNQLELNLDSVISEVQEEKQSKHDDKTDTKEFYPDLIKINDSSFGNAADNDDNEGFIIPDLIEYK